MSQFESAVSVLETAILDYTVNGRAHVRKGNRLSYAAPHGVYRCKGEDRDCVYITASGPKKGKKNDRWCVITVFNEEQWKGFCRVLGNPHWVEDPKFKTLADRKMNEDELDRFIEEWTHEKSPEDIMHRMQQAGVPAGIVQDAEDILTRDPHIKDRGYYVYLDHAEAGHIANDGLPFRLSETPGQISRPAPLMGEHTELVCQKILGMTEEETNQCYVDEVFL
jgi:crotonobetainyl-CoA:carnitine CoA-transferase CaiB-like acyl-CoA transferase